MLGIAHHEPCHHGLSDALPLLTAPHSNPVHVALLEPVFGEAGVADLSDREEGEAEDGGGRGGFAGDEELCGWAL